MKYKLDTDKRMWLLGVVLVTVFFIITLVLGSHAGFSWFHVLDVWF